MESLDLTGEPLAWGALVIFALAYCAVIGEERLGLRKSVPVLVAAGLIWVLVALAYAGLGRAEEAAAAVRHDLLDFGASCSCSWSWP